MQPRRLLVLLNSGAVNGATRQLTHWLPRLDPHEFDTLVVFLRDVGPMGEKLLPPASRVCSHVMKARLDPGGVARLCVLAARFRPGVVFTIDERNALVLGRILGLLTGAAVVQAMHSTSFHEFWPERLTRPLTTAFVALSEAHRAHLASRGYPRARIHVVPNGVPCRDWVERPARAEVVAAFVGVLRQDKGVGTLLRALALIREEAPTLRLVVAGDGPLRPSLEALARRLGLEGRVEFLGWVEDVDSLLRRADMLVVPSDPGVETLSMAALEAMAAGLPVIATDVGSMRDLVTEETGFLVEPGDAQGLSRTMATLWRDPGLRRSLGLGGWKRQRERFSEGELGARMRSLLLQVARGE